MRMLGRDAQAKLYQRFFRPLCGRLRGRQLDAADAAKRGELGAQRSQQRCSTLPDLRRIVGIVESNSEHHGTFLGDRDDGFVVLPRVQVQGESPVRGRVTPQFAKSVVIASLGCLINERAHERVEPRIARILHIDIAVDES